jgi:mannose/fructose/N-acetylgalactosamine-specific phosphotransferase system component IIC
LNPVLSTALLGGALAVDNRSSVRLLVSQPLCGGLLTGLLLGEPRTGFLAGAVLQMLFLGWTNVRGGRSPDLPLGGVAAAALSILVRRAPASEPGVPGLVLLFSIAGALVVCVIGRAFYRYWESRSYVLGEAALRFIGEGRTRLAIALHLSSLAVHFAAGFAIVGAAAFVGPLLIAGMTRVTPAGWSDAMSPLAVMLPFIGAGSLLAVNLARVRLFLFLAGFLVVYLISFFGS